nr:hypothetical protein [Chloroflexota bacterium]
MHWLSLLIGVLVGWLICWLIDYLICRPRRMAEEALLKTKLEQCNEESASLRTQLTGYKDVQARLDNANLEIDSLKAQLARMQSVQADLDACRAQLRQKDLEIEHLNAELAARVSAVTTAAAAPSEPDDLTIIEGIGPKISALLNQNGIYTFAQLAATSVQRLRSILDAGGPRFNLADPQTWPEQALLARDGKWDELKTLQDTLKGGREI